MNKEKIEDRAYWFGTGYVLCFALSLMSKAEYVQLLVLTIMGSFIAASVALFRTFRE